MSNSSQKEWSILLQTKIIIRVLGLFWTYPSPVSFFPSLQLPSEKEKRKFFYLSISRRRQWEKYIKDIHVKIHILLCWILGSSQSCVIGLGRKSVKDGLFIPRQPFPLKSPCSQYEVSAEKCKRFSFPFFSPSSSCLHQHGSKPVLWGIGVYKGPLSQAEQSEMGPLIGWLVIDQKPQALRWPLFIWLFS